MEKTPDTGRKTYQVLLSRVNALNYQLMRNDVDLKNSGLFVAVLILIT